MEENYLKLLEYEEELEKTGKYLSLEKEKELLNYESQNSDFFRWEEKNNFIKAIVDFLEDRIDLDQYIDRFSEIDYEIEESKRKLKSDFEMLRAFEPDDELRTEDEISEKSLRDGIKKFLPKIQDCDPKKTVCRSGGRAYKF